MGGKSSGNVVGYNYYLSVLLALAHGPLDAITQIIVGQRTAWTGSATSSGVIAVDAPNLFGGSTSEGGVQGYVDIMMGADDQTTNDYIAGQVNSGASAGTTVTYQLIESRDSVGDTIYTVNQTTFNNVTGVSTTVQLAQTVDPTDFNAEATANTYFLRTSQTTVVTDDVADTKTWTTVISAGHIPAFRGTATMLFRGSSAGVLRGFPALGDLSMSAGPPQLESFLWSSLNPNFKAPWVRVQRILKGWDNDTPWYPEKAAVAPLNTQLAGSINNGDWRYAEIPQSGFENVTFDDLGQYAPAWSNGNLPATASTTARPNPGPEINWQVPQIDDGTFGYYPLGVRKEFTIDRVTSPIAVSCTSVFSARFFCNGTEIGSINPSVGDSQTKIFTVPASILVAGTNLLAALSEGTRDVAHDDYRWAPSTTNPNEPVHRSQEEAVSALYATLVDSPEVKYEGYSMQETGYPFPDNLRGVVHTYSTYYGHRVDGPVVLVSSVAIPLGFLDMRIVPDSGETLPVDMNPAHIIYQAMTDPTWGMGYSWSSFDQTVWKAAADTLYDEQFGISLRWTNQTTIEDFVKSILNHINGVIRLNTLTSLFELKLIRDDYSVGDLHNLNPSNAVLKSYRKTAWADVASEVVVKYTTRDENPTSVAVQDLGAVQAQGGVVSVTREYPGIRDANLAQRVAMRDLNICASQLTKITIDCNRIAWDLSEGDLFSLTWPERGVGLVAFRVLKMSSGTLADGTIEIEAIEDVFGMPDAVYSVKQPSNWVNPIQKPHAIPALRIVEAPYWDVVKMLSAADLGALPPDYAFGQVLANYGSTGTSPNFTINAATIDDTVDFSAVGVGHYCAYAVLAEGIDDSIDVMRLVGVRNLSAANVGDYAYVGDECVAILSVDLVLGAVTVDRAVLDTVPQIHVAATAVWFRASNYDKTVYESGAQVHYRLAPNTALGSIALSTITSTSILLRGRAEMPYPPGNIKINDTYRPSSIPDQLNSISWASRNRLSQTVSLTPQTAGNITPESGTTYTVAISWAPDSTSPLSTPEVHTGITATSIDRTVFTPIDRAVRVHIEISAQCNGLSSWQTQVLDFTAVPAVSTRVTSDGSRRVTSSGDARISRS